MKPTRDIKSIIESEISAASGYIGSELSENRADALDYYHGEPRGDEIEGRSKVISTDVADAVEWIMPSAVKTFLGSDEIVRFDPVGEGDEDQAEQESDYVNYVVSKENNAFIVFSTWFRDALLQKNGVVKAYWEDAKKEREEYEGLNDQEFAELLADPDVEPVEHDEIVTDQGVFHNLVIHRITSPGKVQIDPIPPEEFLVNSDHNSIDLTNARFTCHETLKPASDLIEQGFDPKVVETLPAWEREDDEEDEARDQLSEDNGEDAGDWSMRLIRVYECYIRVDEDDDGIAELRQIIYAGKKVLSDEPVDRNPFCALTAILQGHKFHGLSIYDRLKQIQDQKTAIWRQLLDNLYLSNNQRTFVKGKVNLNDLLMSRPGGIVRGSPESTVEPLPMVPIGPAGFQMLELLDKQREERAGVGPEMMGQNQSLANDTAHGIERLMSAKEELVGLMIRTFAETGVKSLFLLVRELLMKHQDKEKVFQLRGKWVPVNPSEWRKRMNTTVKVGLGTGDRMKQLQTLTKVLEIHRELIQGGAMGTLLTPKRVYNALEDFAQIGGLVNPDKYYLDPESEEAQQLAQQKAQQPEEPDPAQQLVQLQTQVELIKAQNAERELELKIAKAQSEGGQDAEKQAQEFALKARELDLKEREIELKHMGDISPVNEQITYLTEAVNELLQRGA